MNWTQQTKDCQPSEISYNETGLIIKGTHYPCERPRLEFARSLQYLMGDFYYRITSVKYSDDFYFPKTYAHPYNGFGFERDENNIPIRIPHFGSVQIGEGVEIGWHTVIDPGTIGNTVIGNHTKIGHLVHIAHNVKIGDRCLIVDRAGIGGSSIVGNDCFIGYGATIINKIKIGNNCTIGAGAVVVKDVPDNTTVKGNPAR